MSVRLDAIIPAHNEAATVGAVVSAVLEADVCRAVTVVDDGSTDATADAARSAGAEVLRLDVNRGKAEAMLEGVRRSDAGAIAFFDADLIGLQAAHVELLAEHHRPGVADQVCGLRDYGRFNVLQLLTPVITGERIVKRWVLDRLPLTCWRGYAIETAINFTVDRAGAPRVWCRCAASPSGTRPTRSASLKGGAGTSGWQARCAGRPPGWRRAMDRPANPDHPEAPAPAPVPLPSGRKLLVSLSGTDRTSWALGALALAGSVFGLGVALGRRLRPPAGRAREPR